MPVEMVLAILARCSPCDVMRASRVCRYFNEIIEVHISRLPTRPVDLYIKQDLLHWKMVIAINDWYDTIEEATVASQLSLSLSNATNSLGLNIVRERVQEDERNLVRTSRSVNVPSLLFNAMRRTLRHVHVNFLRVTFIDEINLPGVLRFLRDCYCEMRWKSFGISFLWCDFSYVVYDDWIAFLKATTSTDDGHFFQKFEITESTFSSDDFLLPALAKCGILHKTIYVKSVNERCLQSDDNHIHTIIKCAMLAQESLCHEMALSFACYPLVATNIIDLIEAWQDSNHIGTVTSSWTCKFQISWQDQESIEEITNFGVEFSKVRIHFNSKTINFLIEKRRKTSEILVFFSGKLRCALYLFDVPRQSRNPLDEPLDVWLRNYIVDDYICEMFDMNDLDNIYEAVFEAEDELKTLMNRTALRSRLHVLGIMTKEDVDRSELLELQDDLQELDDELGLY